MPVGDRLGRSLWRLRAAVVCVFLLGLMLLLEGPTKIISHDYSQPSYVHHHHHLCHVLTMTLALSSWWYLILLVALFRQSQALNERWAQRLYGLPVLLLACVGGVTGFYVYTTLESHDEVTYAAVMGVANGSVLIVLSLNCWSLIQNPLRQERSYAWNHLVISAGFTLALFCLFYFNGLHIAAALLFFALAFFADGLYRTKLILVQEKVV